MLLESTFPISYYSKMIVLLKYKRLYSLQFSHTREMVAVRSVTFPSSTMASCTIAASYIGRIGSGAPPRTTTTEISSTASAGS